MDFCLDSLSRYDYLLFTSRFSAIHFLKRLKQRGLSLPAVKVVASGAAVAGYLKKEGVVVDYSVKEESIEQITQLLLALGLKNKKILIPRCPVTADELANKLRQLGAEVDTPVAYQSVKPLIEEKIDLNTIDQIYFLSPWGFDNFLQIYRQIPSTVLIMAIGRPTLDYIRKKGYNVLLSE